MAETETPETEAPRGEVDETVIDKLLGLFQSNSAAIDYGTDPQGWVEENLPEGTEAADVARCMPEVTERLGGPYQANAARYNATHGAAGEAATHSLVNEISYTYNTVYQQNTFIYAEEGAQVVNIQGDGNTVTQTQIDLDFGAEYPEGYEDDEYEDGEGKGEHDPVDELDEDPLDEDPVDPGTDPEDGWEDPVDEGHENPFEDPVVDPVDPAVDPAGEQPAAPEGAEAI